MAEEEGPAIALRQRKKPKSAGNKDSAKEEKIDGPPGPERAPKHVLFQRVAKIFIGCLAAATSGMMYALYLSAYHERKFWFSNRQELEREITFQGDSAIYYSYYKDMLKAPSFERGVYELTHNNKTVSLKTINAVQQMSLYPELIASVLYQATGSNEIIEPVYFYIGIVFGLQGIYVTALFVTSWLMSGTWLAGMLTVAWFIINRVDTTRIEYSIPLRENWALPYFACQIAALTGYLKSNLNTYGERFCYLLMSASTYMFMMMWEYSHYLLFLQAISLFLLDNFSLEQSDKVHEVYKIYIFSLFLGYLLQFENSALLVSPLLSLVVVLMLVKCLQLNVKKRTFVAKIMKVINFYLVCTLTVTLNIIMKTFVPHKENGHMLKFLEVKLGLNMTKNFTMNWLLCQESLQAPSQEFFLRLTQSSLLPFYILVLIICFLSMMQVIFRRLNGESLEETVTLEDGRIGERPEIIYHVIHTIFFGSLAMIIEGLKYLWTPYVCMLAAFGVCSPELWTTLFKWLRLRTVHPVLLALILSMAVPTIIGISLWKEFFPRLMTELTELQEFYDPDTVELMTWIKRHAPVAAVFAGSPQLMGAIKLCTGWMVTSLPLYNDDDLLKRNENIYQIYSKRSAEDIYKILTSYKANYLIVEDAICNEVGTMRGCRVKDLLDIANGHVVCEEGDKLTYSKYGRFCHEVKINYSPYVNYFTRVYWNRSYFVYKINTVILSVPVLNMLLNELLCVSKVPPGTKHVDMDLATLPPTTAMAILLYNRWAIRTIVQSSFPIKQAKPGPPQLSVMNQMQQEKELTENILKVLKEQASDSILVLEAALKLNKDLYVHTMRTLDLLAMEPGMVNGETESSTAGLKIKTEEMQCQVCYDLGAAYFQQGSANSAVCENAREKFFRTKELIAEIGSLSLHCTIDEKRLAGYCQACDVLVPSSDITSQQLTPYSQVHICLRSGNYQEVIKIFIEDNLTFGLPVQFRQSVLRELFQKAQQGNEALDEICFKVCACNTVRDILEGRTISVQFNQLFLRPNKEKIDFLLEVCSRSINLEKPSDSLKGNMASFLKNVCLGLEDLQYVFMISSHELFITLLKDEERKLLVDQMRKRSPRVNLCIKPVTSFYDIPASASVNIGQLEHQLILSVDPWRIRQILIELHGMTSERQFWTVSNKWEVPSVYSGVILGIKDNLTRDLVYILMAKGLHCSTVMDFSHAKQLFAACLELVTEFSPKLRQVMLNEMLLLDIYTHEAGTGQSGERPPSDLSSRVRGYLEMRLPDIPLRQVIAEECVAFMLNWKENEYLTLQVPAFLLQSNPYVKLGQLLAATIKELPGPKESRRTAKDLWEVVVQICSVSSQHKRGNDGRVSLIKQRESTLGIMYRSELLSFIKKLREPLVLTIILSLFVKLHNVREDIVNDITAEHISIWPSSIPNLQSVDFEAVAITVKELVRYARSVNPNNHSWLIIQADIYFATNQYSAALHYYLQAGAVCSDFFNKAVPPDVYTDQVIKRMIKCCSLLNCHTQVAILCQFLREIDYKTAFKSLQEQNSHDAMDSYYDYIWDVTILEYLTYLHHKRGETDKRQIAIKAIGQTELNASNPEEVLQLAAQRRKKKFLQAMAKLYF